MRLLDLYCGEGLAAWGYWLSGRFTEIVGVDIDNQMSARYSFDFINMSAGECTYEFLDQFDFIHASPPCQGYSRLTPDQFLHPRLVEATHLMLYASGKPYVIENVEGSGKDLRPNVVMDGHYFKLPSERRRYFHVSTLKRPLRLMSSGRTIDMHGGNYVNRRSLIEALGLDVINARRLSNITMHGMEQGVAPVMTKYIAETLFPHKALIG